jgi:hypothetical protein
MKISYEQFEKFIKQYYLQSIKELTEMEKDDEEYSEESVRLNSEENVMTNVNMIIEEVNDEV